MNKNTYPIIFIQNLDITLSGFFSFCKEFLKYSISFLLYYLYKYSFNEVKFIVNYNYINLDGDFIMTAFFSFDKRLGISIPSLQMSWEFYNDIQQQMILLKWEQIRGNIPDRIKQLEECINEKQEKLNNEDDFERSCLLNNEIAELASTINDLWLYYRTQQHLSDNDLKESKRHF